MGDVEINICDFCKEVKSVSRTYLRPSKYKKPTDIKEFNKLYNQGDYFIIVSTCSDCGEPTDIKL